MNISPTIHHRLRASSPETAAVMLQPIHESSAVAKLTSLPLHDRNKTKRGKVSVATGKAIRPLNSWIAFRSYYSPIFSSLQQKEISGFLTYLWQAEPCKGKWSIVAKAYSLVRDLKGKEYAPLDAFLKINAPYVGIVRPEEYMSVLGWDVEIDQIGQIILLRTAHSDVSRFDNDILTTNVSVEDVIRNTYELGYINGDDGANVAIPGNEAALTMAATAQPVGSDDISRLNIGGLSDDDSTALSHADVEWLNAEIMGNNPSTNQDITRPKSPVGPSDFNIAGEHPFNGEFEPGLQSMTFDPFVGNQFNAFDIGDGYEINDFDIEEWILDA